MYRHRPEFRLPQTAGLSDIETYTNLASKLESLTSNAGRSSTWFQTRCEHVRSMMQEHGTLDHCLDSPRDVRVVLHLWETDTECINRVPPNSLALKTLRECSRGFRASHVAYLIELYFHYYDGFADREAFPRAILHSLEEMPSTKLPRYLLKLYNNKVTLFESNAAFQVAKAIRVADGDFNEALQDLGVPVDKPGRFMEVCKQRYYLEIIQSIEPGFVHRLFDEILQPAVKESPYDRTLNLGQAVATAMIARCLKADLDMPSEWLNILVAIMGDPRRGPRSVEYQKWWGSLPSTQIALVRKWLAGADLKLFLQILEDSSTDEHLRRLFPDRRDFLEGLLRHHNVNNVRLFVGGEAAEYIARRFKHDLLGVHGRLQDRYKTVIHIQVDGVHLFEGTHHYAARIGTSIPDASRLMQISQMHFSYRELTAILDTEMAICVLRDPNNHAANVRHSRAPKWQRNLINEFRKAGVQIDPELVMSPERYREYRKLFGF